MQKLRTFCVNYNRHDERIHQRIKEQRASPAHLLCETVTPEFTRNELTSRHVRATINA